MPSKQELEILSLPATQAVGGRVEHFWSDNPRLPAVIDTILICSLYNPESEDRFVAKACRDFLNLSEESMHFLINRMGIIFQSVPVEYSAWYAGRSRMPHPDAREGVNRFGIGIGVIGDEESEVNEEQYSSLVLLLAQIFQQFPIQNVLGRQDVSVGELGSDQKTDPWNFDWAYFFSLLKIAIGEDRYQEMKLLGGDRD